jgi:hypothetical protein
MTVRIKCTTQFDITATGVRNRSHKSRVPYYDDSGQRIVDDSSWVKSRSQQSNWETINQIISMRTLPENISIPEYNKDAQQWTFEFDVINPETVEKNNDPVGFLRHDCNSVPMITGLNEHFIESTVLITEGDNTNIWFKVLNK